MIVYTRAYLGIFKGGQRYKMAKNKNKNCF